MFFELGVFLTRSFDKLAEADELFTLVFGDQVSTAQAPCFLESSHKMNEFRIVPQLRVDDFNILSVSLHEEILQIVVASLYVSAKLTHCNTLGSADLAANFIRNDQYRNIKVITPLTYTVRHLVNLADLAEELVSLIVILLIG